MSSKTRILVIKLKEILFTILFVVLGIILIILLFLIFTGKNKAKEDNVTSQTYSPGVYSSSIALSSNPVELLVTVDSNQIKSINLVNVSESVATMYPLISSSLEDIASQVIQSNQTSNITYSGDSRYTSLVLLSAIEQALDKARLK